MRAVEQWAAIEEALPEDWAEARVAFAPEGDLAEATQILAPVGPGRVGTELLVHVARASSGGERLRTALRRMDERRVWGTLRLVDAEVASTPDAEAALAVRPCLTAAWDELLETLPPDWSDALVELQLDSSDHLARAALLGAPLNPTRNPDAIALRFRASGKAGYGTPSGMVRRCFERMDAEHITGRLSVVVELSDAEKAVTQGPVWRVAGRSV